MSKDIYERFKAAQEALAAQKAAEYVDYQRKIGEAETAEAVRRAAEAERVRREFERQKQSRLEREAKIVNAKEQMAPVREKLLEILEAIRQHDPVVQLSAVNRITFNTGINEGKDGNFTENDMIQFAWGNRIDPPVVGRNSRTQNRSLLDRIRSLGFFASLRQVMIEPDEDFSLVTVAANITTITAYPSGHSIGTSMFLSSESSVLPLLAESLSNPIRRCFIYVEGLPMDINGRVWAYTEVNEIGERLFRNHSLEANYYSSSHNEDGFD